MKPQESMAHWWNPGRPGVKLGPEWFREKLHGLGDDLEVTWNAFRERWCIFMKQPKVTHPIAKGWSLLLVVEGADGEFLPLDERILARLYSASQKRWGSGAKYWEALEREAERDKARLEAETFQATMDQALESFDHSKISVSMVGQSNGSKFSDYHA